MKVSIIVPCYNVGSYIKECLLSIIGQTFQNIECIVVNDATRDCSWHIVTDFVASYHGEKKFVLLTHSENKGLSAARNTGIKVATGDYIFFCDSDDKLFADAIANLVSIAIKFSLPDCVIGNYEVFGTSHIQFPQNGSELVFCNSNKDILNTYLSYKWYPMAWNKLVKRKVFTDKNMLFKEGMLHEDELWSYQLALSISSLAFCSTKTYLYRVREKSITSKKSIKNFEDNLYYCSYILNHTNEEVKRNTISFVLNRMLSILIEMKSNGATLKEITYIRNIINKELLPKVSLERGNRYLKNLLRYPILKLSRPFWIWYLFAYSVLIRLR